MRSCAAARQLFWCRAPLRATRLTGPPPTPHHPSPPPPPPPPPPGSKKRNQLYADKNYGAVLTLLQFALIALLSLQYVCTWKGGALRLLPMRVPWQKYVEMAAYFVVMSILNNLAFSFNISQPMHMVFRSSNLMVSYVYGYAAGKRYTRQQLAAVVLLTLGALCATWAEMRLGETADAAAKTCTNCGDSAAGGAAAAAAGAGGGGGGGGWLGALLNSEAEGGALYLLRWWMGIGILVVCLVLQTRLGALQEACRTQYGDAPFEMLFFFHFFSLPAFAFCAASLPATLARWSASHSALAELRSAWGVSSGALGAAWPLLPLLRLPVMWVHVAVNCVTQFVCLVGVYRLIAQVDQLGVNVALTVRKFISLMLSIWVFGNKFTGFHWLGAVLVIGGSAYFSMAPKPPPAAAAAAAAGGGEKEGAGAAGAGGAGGAGAGGAAGAAGGAAGAGTGAGAGAASKGSGSGQGATTPQLIADSQAESAGARNRAARGNAGKDAKDS